MRELVGLLPELTGRNLGAFVLQQLIQCVIEIEVEACLGAKWNEIAPGVRKRRRNGYRERSLTTVYGKIVLKIPRLREGRFMPRIVAERRRCERGLAGFLQEAWIGGVSTRGTSAAIGDPVSGGVSKSAAGGGLADRVS